MDADINDLIERALIEDLGPEGLDATCAALASDAIGSAQIRTRVDCCVAGMAVASAVFRAVDDSLSVEVILPDGSNATAGDGLLKVSGRAASILTAERTALNFAQRLSGIATLTRAYVRTANRPELVLLDTRKTTPGWRALEKAAVVCGGGVNHRMGLYDAVMIKDNHLALWGRGSIVDAVQTARARFPRLKIEVEVDTLDQLREVLDARPDWVLLDNMEPQQLRLGVEMCRGICRTEASGGITLSTIQAVAATGVDAVSVGALTHSAGSIDLGLDVEDAILSHRG